MKNKVKITATSAFSLFLLCLLVSLVIVKTSFDSGDTAEMYVQSRALAEQHKLQLDDYVQDLPTNRQNHGPDGHIYSKYGVGYPLLVAGLETILSHIGLKGLISGVRLFFVPSFLLYLLALGCLYCSFARLNPHNKLINLFAVLSFGFSTIAFYYARAWPGNSVECSLAIISFSFVVKTYWPHESQNKLTDFVISRRYQKLVLAGAVAGFSGLSRPYAFAILPGLILLSIARNAELNKSSLWSRSVLVKMLLDILMIVAPAILFLIAHLFIMKIKTGSILGTTYPGEGFTTPFMVGFLGSLFMPGKSFLFFAPLVILSPFGLAEMYKRVRPVFIFVIWMCIIYVVLMSKWWAWHSGPDLGQRFWLPVLPFLIMSLAFLRTRLLSTFLMICLLFGLYTQARLYCSNARGVFMSIYKGDNRAEEVFEPHETGYWAKRTFLDMVFFDKAAKFTNRHD